MREIRYAKDSKDQSSVGELCSGSPGWSSEAEWREEGEVTLIL